ncbi:retrovirus-related pol polyprotein from transposon TNT 1-94 [Tanacetum coccineum]
MWNSIQNGPYVRPMIPNPDDAKNINGTVKQILEPLSKMTEGNKKQYIADVKERIKRLMFGSDDTSHVRHSRLMDEFDKFAAKEGESLESVYERLTTLVNIMDRNNVHPISVSINTKFLNFVDYEDEYQEDLQGDSQEDKLTTTMMLLARAITQKFSTPTNNHLRTLSNTRNQAMIQDGELTYKPRMQVMVTTANVQCYNCNEKGHYSRDCQKPRVRDAKYFKEKMLLAIKDEAGSNLNNEENDFMLDTSNGEETMEELTAAIMLMARIQPGDGNAETMPSYNAKVVSEVNASSKVHEQMRHEKCKTIIQTSDDDQIDSNIIFNDPYVENNGDTSDHDSNTHDEYHKIQMLAYDIQREAENKKRLNNELEKQKMMLQKELETSKKAFKEQENRYLEDIVDLEEKLSSHDRIVYKMGQSIQTIHMLGKTPNKVYDPFLKDGLGYKNTKRLKKVIAAQPKMYDGEKLHSVNLKIDSPDSEKTLEDAKEIRLKMRHKMLKFSTLNDENVLLKTQLESVVQERENIKLEFQKLFNSIKATRTQHQKEVDELIEHVNQKTYAYADVRAQNQDFLMTISELKDKLRTNEKGKHVNTKFDKSETLGKLVCVESSNSVRRPKSKGTKSKNRVLKKTKSSSAYVWKISCSVSIDSNKCETKDSNVCETNASVSNSKTVNAVNDGSTIVCVSCGKDVFLLSHEKCVACYALSRNSNVKRALFTTPIAARSKNLGATSIVAKSRLSVIAINKVIQLILWIVDSRCLKHMTGNLQLLRNFIERFMGTVRFENDHFAVIIGYGDYV